MSKRVGSEDCKPFSLGYAYSSLCCRPLKQFIYFYIYLFAYWYATFVMNEVTSHKKRGAQVTQDLLSSVIFRDTFHDEIINFVNRLCRVSMATIY